MMTILLALAAHAAEPDVTTYNLTLDCAILSTVTAEFFADTDPAATGRLRAVAAAKLPLVRAHAGLKGMTEAQAMADFDRRAQRYRDAYARATPERRQRSLTILDLQATSICAAADKGWAKAGL